MTLALKGWGLVSTHGAGAGRFMQALCGGKSVPSQPSQSRWPVPANGRSMAFYIPGEREGSVRSQLAARLGAAWQEALAMLTAGEQRDLRENCAVLFASTKGCVEDFIWITQAGDPYAPVLQDFLTASGLQPKRALTVSNACASSHSAIDLASAWLKRGAIKYVVVVAADQVGPFVLQGFHALHALSPTMIRPFDRERDGLLLGEAGAVAILSSGEGQILISGSSVDCEGHAVTRPESSAASLQRALRAAMGKEKLIDAVISHGTATQANDRAEDRAFSEQLPDRAWITGTKWSVGHTLGASGLVDLIAGAEWLKNGTPFSIATCREPDPEFRSRILTEKALAALPPRKWNSLLISSLGFGGVHAALRLVRS